jgi:hypothetical protein
MKTYKQFLKLSRSKGESNLARIQRDAMKAYRKSKYYGKDMLFTTSDSVLDGFMKVSVTDFRNRGVNMFYDIKKKKLVADPPDDHPWFEA